MQNDPDTQQALGSAGCLGQEEYLLTGWKLCRRWRGLSSVRSVLFLTNRGSVACKVSKGQLSWDLDQQCLTEWCKSISIHRYRDNPRSDHRQVHLHQVRPLAL